MGGSKKQTVGYRYFAGMHMVMSHGPIDRLLRVKVDDRVLWEGNNTGGAITVNKRDMFGGESREGGISGTFDFMPGRSDQMPNSYLTSVLGPLVPAFRGVASVVLRQMYLSMNPYLKPWAFLVSRIHVQQDGSPQWQDALSQIDVTVYDEDGEETSAAMMNPAHIIRECLTNRLWGMGYPTSDIDNASFLAAAQTLFNEKMGMSLLWDTQKSIEDFVRIVLQHIDASLYVNRRTGLFTLKLVRGDYNADNLLVLDESNIDKIEDFKRPTFGELCTSITVNYWDYTKGETASVTVQDIALEQEQGEGGNNTTVTYEGFCDPATASKAAQRDLRTLSTPLIACTIYATKAARNLNIGDVFKLTWPDFQVSEVIMRVTGIAYGNGKTRRVRIQCAQDVFSYPEDAFISRPPSEWVSPVSPPGAARYQMAFELPYFELVREVGQATIDGQIATNPYIGYVAGAASPPLGSLAINGIVHTNAGAGYEEVATLEFCAGAELAEDISYLDTSFTIQNAVSAALFAANEWVQIGGELMGVVSLVGNVLTVKRGVLDTTPKEHSAGAVILAWDGLAGADPTEYVASDVVNVKITPANSTGVYPLSSAVALPVEVVGRAARPFPPGNVLFNGLYRPEIVSGVVSITWSERNRISQTGGELVGYFDGTLTPEVGTTYTIRVWFGEVLIDEITGITGTSYSLNVADYEIPFAEIEIYSVRDGLISMQTQRFAVEIPYTATDFLFEETGYVAPDGDDVNFVFGG